MQNYTGESATGDDELLDLLDSESDIAKESPEDVVDLIELLEEEEVSAPSSNSLQDMNLSDLLDYKYESQEKQQTNSEFLSFEYDYDTDELGIAVTQDVDPLRDQDLFDHDDEDEYEQDIELIKELQSKLTSAGYKHIELYDYEQLEKLLDQEESLYSDSLYDDIKASFVEAFNKVSSAVQSSKATLMKSNSSVRTLAQDMPAASSALSEYFTKLVWRDLEILVASNQDRPDLESYITINLVINRLNKTLPPDQKIYLESVDLYQYLLIAIPAAINSVKAAKATLLEDEMQKTKIVNYILRDESKAVKAIENSDGKFIKQVFRRGDNFTYYCTCCDKEVRLPNNIISYVLYAAERDDSNASIMPHLIVCPECGQEHLLAFTQYLSIRNALSAIYKPSASELFKFLCKVSTGTAITKINPSLQDIAGGMDLICDLGLDERFDEKVITKKPSNLGATIYTDLEYDRAIEDFYNKLLIFGKPKEESIMPLDNMEDDMLLEKLDEMEIPNSADLMSGHLSYKEVALCVTSELSMSYQVTKNRALYSLIMFLSEYDYLRAFLDCTNLWDLQNKLVVLNKADNINANDKEYIAYYRQIASEINRGDIESLEELKSVMIAHRTEITKEIESLKASRAELIDFIERNLDLFAHTKILNINQISFREIAKFCNSTQFSKFLDELTDRMIINNYSEKFAETLFKSSVLRGLKVKTCLLNMADGDTLQDSLLHTLEQKRISVPAPIAARFRYVSANHLKGIKEASKALKNYEYYNFIEALSQVEDPSTLISLDADSKLQQAVNLAKIKWDELKHCDYVQFYLKDFTKNEIDEIDPSFRAELAHMVFGKYVPKRLEGESLTEYIVRYRNLDNNGLLSADISYDYSEYFEEFKDYFIAIIAGSNILDLNYGNFAIANFVRSWLYLVTNHFDREYGIGSLGYKEQYFNRLSALNSYVIKEHYFEFVDNTYRVLNGIYFDASGEFVNQYLEAYDSYTLNERADLSALDVITYSKIMQELESMETSEINRLESRYQNAKRTSGEEVAADEVIISKEDMINSLESFTEV